MDVTGTLIVQMDNLSLQGKEGQITLNVGGKERTPTYADGVLLGFSEKTVAATVSGTVASTSETDMLALSNAKNVTITVILDTGKRYVVRGAAATKPAELSGDAGDIAVEYMGQPAVEG